MSSLIEIERFLRRNDMTPSRFGREVAHDPMLVKQLRAGRDMRPAMRDKVKRFIADYRESN